MLTNIFTAIKLIFELIGLVKLAFNKMDAAEREAFFQKSPEVFKELKEAKTPEAKREAIKALAKLWKSI